MRMVAFLFPSYGALGIYRVKGIWVLRWLDEAIGICKVQGLGLEYWGIQSTFPESNMKSCMKTGFLYAFKADWVGID